MKNKKKIVLSEKEFTELVKCIKLASTVLDLALIMLAKKS